VRRTRAAAWREGERGVVASTCVRFLASRTHWLSRRPPGPQRRAGDSIFGPPLAALAGAVRGRRRAHPPTRPHRRGPGPRARRGRAVVRPSARGPGGGRFRGLTLLEGRRPRAPPPCFPFFFGGAPPTRLATHPWPGRPRACADHPRSRARGEWGGAEGLSGPARDRRSGRAAGRVRTPPSHPFPPPGHPPSPLAALDGWAVHSPSLPLPAPLPLTQNTRTHAHHANPTKTQGSVRAAAAKADRPLWFPGNPAPPYLDGSRAFFSFFSFLFYAFFVYAPRARCGATLLRGHTIEAAVERSALAFFFAKRAGVCAFCLPSKTCAHPPLSVLSLHPPNTTVPGDYGFDPLRLGSMGNEAGQYNLEWMRMAEVFHGRLAMVRCFLRFLVLFD
jgi:hypothetical protein